jgi:hypothetical protein
MHKLVILVEAQGDMQEFHDRWPEFLRLAEKMPGLLREATSQVEHFLVGRVEVALMHEMFFGTLGDLQAALNSTSGQEAGKTLQRITGGKVSLFFADHKEDELANFQKAGQPADAQPGRQQGNAA